MAIGELAIAGEQAGFCVEQMVGLLNDGLTVETLLDLHFIASGVFSSNGSNEWLFDVDSLRIGRTESLSAGPV
jgi:hypothetical protein